LTIIAADYLAPGSFFRKSFRPAATIFLAMARQDTTSGACEPAADRIDWSAVWPEHGRWLRTVVLARVGEPAAVDDVLQDVALTAVEKGHQLRDPRSVAPWLYRLAVVAALQYRRRQGRRRKLVERFTASHPSVDSDTREADPLDWLLADERQAMVRRALARLPKRDAEILLLKYTEDWSYQQISEHLGISTSAVEARLHRARHKMRQALARVDPSLAPAVRAD
jgi:RNA polymerase sigma-70 factor (ECF subfamily)